MAATGPHSSLERIRHHLVSLRMPRALEALDGVVQQLERGQVAPLDAIDTLLAEEITVREGRRIKAGDCRKFRVRAGWLSLISSSPV